MTRGADGSDPERFASARILIVEDEYFIALDLANNLMAEGAIVLGPISSVEEALETIAGGAPIDWAVLDINLGGEMSYPVADALRERKVPFVFATGYEDATIPARYDHAPRRQKPVSMQELLKSFQNRNRSAC
jgi:CheY-like chemotaxis protein